MTQSRAKLCSRPGFRWALVLLTMGLIFLGSHSSRSFQHSSRFLVPVIKWFWPTITPRGLGTAILVVRKCGHVTEYALLALAVWWAMRSNHASNSWKPVRIAFLVAFLYAVSDEFHQTLVPNRQGSPWDVLIDTTGAALALTAAHLVTRRKPTPELSEPISPD